MAKLSAGLLESQEEQTCAAFVQSANINNTKQANDEADYTQLEVDGKPVETAFVIYSFRECCRFQPNDCME